MAHRGLSSGEAVAPVFCDDDVEPAPGEVGGHLIVIGGHLPVAVKEEEGGQLLSVEVAANGNALPVMGGDEEIKAVVGFVRHGEPRAGVKKKAEDILAIKGGRFRHDTSPGVDFYLTEVSFNRGLI